MNQIHIAVVGLGYVGLPLSLQFARRATRVTGLDIARRKVDALNAGRSYIMHIEGAAVQELVEAGQFSASDDFALVREVDAVIICVPTPLSKNREPDISYILATGRGRLPRPACAGHPAHPRACALDGHTVGGVGSGYGQPLRRGGDRDRAQRGELRRTRGVGGVLHRHPQRHGRPQRAAGRAV